MGDVASPAYPSSQPQNNNLLSDPAKVLGLIGQMNQNALFQQSFNARKAIGQAYQGAIQDDGSIDTNTLMQGIKHNPDAGFMAGEASAGALSRQGQQIDNAQKMFGLQAGQNKLLLDGLGTLADKPKVTDEDLRNFATTAARNSGVPTSQILSVLGSAPKDPAKRKEWLTSLRNIAIGSAGTAERVSAPPADTGAPQQSSKGAINYQGTTPTGLAPGVGEAQRATGEGSGAALNEARHRGLNYRQEVFPLEAAIPALEKLGKTGTGPGTEEFNHVKSFLQSAGIPGLDTDKIKTFDEAKKYLTDFVNQNGNTGTNDKLAASFAGNPSVGISNAAAVDVAKSALSLRRMKQAQLVEFEKSGLPDSEFAKWASRWQLGHDPRAYGFDLMTPDQRKKVLGELPESKQQLFQMAVQDAAEQGIIKVPQKSK